MAVRWSIPLTVMNFAGDLGIADGGRPILGHVLRPSSGPLLSWQAGLLADFTRLRVLSQRGAVRALDMGFVSREF